MLVKIFQHVLQISLAFFLLGCEHRSEKNENIRDILTRISDRQKDEIEIFFTFLLCNNECAYTLFGNKPITVVDISLDPLSVWYLCHPNEYIALERGWVTWQKYSALFPSNVFLIKENKSKNVHQLFFINKKSALNAIYEHIAVFQDIFGVVIQPEKLLEDLCKPEKNCMETLKNSPILLGILLGYGEHNSRFFVKRSQLCVSLHQRMNPPYVGYEEDILSPMSRSLVNLKWRGDHANFSYSYHSLAEELNYIVANEEDCELESGHYLLEHFLFPAFIAEKNHPETEKLKKSYLDTREKIYQKYSEKPFLEVTLKQWMYPK